MQRAVCYSYLESPLGRLLLTAEGPMLTGLYMPGHRGLPQPKPEWQQDDAALASARATWGLFFRPARAVRLAAANGGDAVSTTGLARTSADSLRHDDQLRGTGRAHRPAEIVPGRGRCERTQPNLDHRALPSRDRSQRQPDRLRRRAGKQTVAARDGATRVGNLHAATCHSIARRNRQPIAEHGGQIGQIVVL